MISIQKCKLSFNLVQHEAIEKNILKSIKFKIFEIEKKCF